MKIRLKSSSFIFGEKKRSELGIKFHAVWRRIFAYYIGTDFWRMSHQHIVWLNTYLMKRFFVHFPAGFPEKRAILVNTYVFALQDIPDTIFKKLSISFVLGAKVHRDQ